MARHGFGCGEYKYFAYPLPEPLAGLRPSPTAGAASWAWTCAIPIPCRPSWTAATQPARKGQPRSSCNTARGDYNCLHQDLYGEHVFPLQAAILLSRPGRDFTGGEFVMTETTSGAQPAEVVPLSQGDAVVFPVDRRPVPGRRGPRQAAMRHGVSRVYSGRRYAAGLIFHDAR